MKNNQHCIEGTIISTSNPMLLLEKIIVGAGVLLFIGILAFMILFVAMYVM